MKLAGVSAGSDAHRMFASTVFPAAAGAAGAAAAAAESMAANFTGLGLDITDAVVWRCRLKRVETRVESASFIQRTDKWEVCVSDENCCPPSISTHICQIGRHASCICTLIL